MTARFVVRLLDAAGVLLSWAEVYAEARPQERGASCPFFALQPTTFFIEQNGLASQTTIHWCDLDVARTQAILEPVPVQVGQIFTFAWMEPVWLVPGMRDVALPAVTVRKPVSISVPVGNLSAV